ncbi:MAG: HAD family phosphatase [Myxococcota bacterium]
MQPIRAVLFDFGGVFTASPFHIFVEAAAELGAAPDRVLDHVFGPYDRDTDHPWHRLERGEIGLGDARNAIMARAAADGLEFDPLQILARLAGGEGVRKDVVASVEATRRAGCKTALVTNNVVEFRASWEASLPVGDLFDVVVDSSEVGVRKPDPMIFHLALEQLGVEAGHAVFLDDYPGNIQAAEGVGVRGILVEPDPGPALASLAALLPDPAATR